MLNEIRLNEIMNILQIKKQATTDELCSTLHCSISTLRRDLIKLEQQGLINRIHGGAVLVSATNHEFAWDFRENNHIKEKKKIADLAVDFIGPGMCLFLDSSSTVMQLAPMLKNIPDLIIVTNGLQLAVELSNNANPTHKMYLMGGELKNNSNAIVANNEDPIFKSIRFDLALFSSLGLDENGIYEARLSQASVKQSILKNTKSSLLLIDHSKIGRTHFIKLADFHNFSAIITNKKPDNRYLENAKTEWVY